MTSDRRKFWEGKILKWESAKYDQRRLIDFNASLKHRQSLSLQLMKPVIKGCTVVEYGCGTARLMEPILALGAKKYIGVDFSTSAIQTAQNRVKSFDAAHVDLLCADIAGLDVIPAELSFSLGLLDWVDPKDVVRLTAPLFLHSFSELKPSSWQQLAHRAYCRWVNGEEHLPKYYRKEDLQQLFDRARIKFYHNPNLAFGGFIHNLV